MKYIGLTKNTLTMALLCSAVPLSAALVNCGGAGTAAFDPLSTTSNSNTYVEICSASLFPATPGKITSIAFQSVSIRGTPPQLGSFIYASTTNLSPLSPPASINAYLAGTAGSTFYPVYDVSGNSTTQTLTQTKASQNGTFDNVFTFQTPFAYDPSAGNFAYELDQLTNFPLSAQTGAVGLQSGPSPTAGQTYFNNNPSAATATGGYGLLVQINFVPNSPAGGGPSTVPEPGTGTLLALGIAGAGAARQFRQWISKLGNGFASLGEDR